jgi:hypothetical protein
MIQVTVLVQRPAGTPTSPDEYRALVDRRDEINSQLRSAQDRRTQLQVEMRMADVTSQASLKSQLQSTNARVADLQQQLDHTNDQIINTSPDVLAALRSENQAVVAAGNGRDFPSRIAGDIVPLVAIFTIFFLAPIAIAMSRWIWKRASAPPRSTLADSATTQRLEQLQQSMDSIALEVERISEGQRYVTKLFNEKEPSRAALKS